jgi:hypothetical protein
MYGCDCDVCGEESYHLTNCITCNDKVCPECFNTKYCKSYNCLFKGKICEICLEGCKFCKKEFCKSCRVKCDKCFTTVCENCIFKGLFLCPFCQKITV